MTVLKFFLSFSSYIIVAFLFFIPFIIYRSWYPKCITCLRIRCDSSPETCPVKPNKAFFRSISLNRNSSFVSIGNGYFVYYCASDHCSDLVSFQQISISDEIYIFSRSRLGRFKSIDVSDRCLIDSLKKFINN